MTPHFGTLKDRLLKEFGFEKSQAILAEREGDVSRYRSGKFGEESKNILYTDESWVNTG
jgi:hypothetical protein